MGIVASNEPVKRLLEIIRDERQFIQIIQNRMGDEGQNNSNIGNLETALGDTTKPKVFVGQTPGGTGTSYEAISGAINGSNTTFIVNQKNFIPGDAQVFLLGQLMTLGADNDWVQTSPSSGVIDFVTAPVAGDIITIVYRKNESTGPTYDVDQSEDTAGVYGLIAGAIDGANRGYTIANPDGYLTTTLRVYLNGQLMIQGTGEDWGEATSTTFTMDVAPIVGDLLTAVYQPAGTAEQDIDQSGGTSDTYGIVFGTIDGSNATFTVGRRNYLSGSLRVFLNGELLTQGTSSDWKETLPDIGEFEFVAGSEPVSSPTLDEITVEYVTQDGRKHIHYAGMVRTASAYTITLEDEMVTADATSAAFTVTLPTASSAAGLEFNTKKIDSSSNIVTLNVSGGGTIDDATSQTLTGQYDNITTRSDGVEYWIR